ncbi:MAG: esterase/lipase family protein [Sandaracinaceae bacterium]
MAVPTIGGAQLWADRRWRDGWRIQQHVLTGHYRLLDPNDRRHVSGELSRCVERLEDLRLPAAPSDIVVLLHGLGRTRRSLFGLGDALDAAGHVTVRLDYPSTRAAIEDHVSQVLQVLSDLPGASRVGFVTHSLGGILARGILADGRWPRSLTPTRVVMLAPPNAGAALARVLDGVVPSLFGAVMGPSGRAIGQGVPYPAPRVPFLVVAGSQRGGKGLNPMLDGDDDGVVKVEETKLTGMDEHLVVPALHTVIMDHPDARAATVSFLQSPGVRTD